MMIDIEITRYEKSLKNRWDQFIAKSKNGLFLFNRDYMDYHSDRFEDHSVMFFKNNKLFALMPASIKDDTLNSHGGLTFGGIISDKYMRSPIMVDIFDVLIKYLRHNGISKLIYKAIPHIYHDTPAEEDLYALFLNNAVLYRRDLSSTIKLDVVIKYNKGRKWSVKKSKNNGLQVKRSYNFKEFINIEESILKRKYDTRPTHTAEELELLANIFPDNIKLFTVFKEERMVAGVVMYESKNVAHTQYIGSTDEGKELFAQDFLLDYLIKDYYKQKKSFDFGISTEKDGRFLNSGLVQYKEGFGASSVMYDFYQIELD